MSDFAADDVVEREGIVNKCIVVCDMLLRLRPNVGRPISYIHPPYGMTGGQHAATPTFIIFHCFPDFSASRLSLLGSGPGSGGRAVKAS